MPPENVTLDELHNYAQNKIGDLRTMTALGIEYAIEKHKQVKITINIDPSFVIVPKFGDIISADTILLLSLGKFKFKTNLVPKSNIAKVRDMIKENKNIMEEMKKHAYENYYITIDKIQIILSNQDFWESDLKSDVATSRHLLCPFVMSGDINRCIISNETKFPRLICSATIPEIEMNASDWQIQQLMGLITTLPTPAAEKSFDHKRSQGISKLSESLGRDTQDSVRSQIRSTAPSKSSNTNELTDALQFVTQIMKTNEAKSKKKPTDDETDSVRIFKIVTFDFKIDKIGFNIFQRIPSKERYPLANFSLVKFVVFGEVLSNDSLWLNGSLSDMKLDDTRTIRKNPKGIRTMLSKS